MELEELKITFFPISHLTQNLQKSMTIQTPFHTNKPILNLKYIQYIFLPRSVTCRSKGQRIALP